MHFRFRCYRTPNRSRVFGGDTPIPTDAVGTPMSKVQQTDVLGAIKPQDTDALGTLGPETPMQPVLIPRIIPNNLPKA